MTDETQPEDRQAENRLPKEQPFTGYKDKIKVLDHGYVEFIEAYGTGKAGVGNPLSNDPMWHVDYECGIIEAARQSTQASFRGWEHDAKLLNYLYNSEPKHMTPFEFSGLVIEVQAPIMVFREWHRHRTQSYNEMSARYAPLPDLYYEPSSEAIIERAQKAATDKNKQAAGIAAVDAIRIWEWHQRDLELSFILEEHYKEGLACGVPKELARKKMPVDHYTRMRAQANLRNWLAFITLRTDPKAMWEIQQFAYAVERIIKDKFPRTWEIYGELRQRG